MSDICGVKGPALLLFQFHYTFFSVVGETVSKRERKFLQRRKEEGGAGRQAGRQEGRPLSFSSPFWKVVDC